MSSRAPTAEELLAAWNAMQAAWKVTRRKTDAYHAIRARCYAIEGSEVLAKRNRTNAEERECILKLVRAERAAARRAGAEKGKKR